jgi:hypothetical protein
MSKKNLLLLKQGSNRGKGKKEAIYLYKSDSGSLESGGDYDIDSNKTNAYLYEDDTDDKTYFANISGNDDNVNLYLVRIDLVSSLIEHRWLVNSGATSHISGNPKFFI